MSPIKANLQKNHPNGREEQWNYTICCGVCVGAGYEVEFLIESLIWKIESNFKSITYTYIYVW